MKTKMLLFALVLCLVGFASNVYAQTFSVNTVYRAPYTFRVYNYNQSTGQVGTEVAAGARLTAGKIYYFTIVTTNTNAATMTIDFLDGADVSGVHCAGCTFQPYPIPFTKDLGWVPRGINGYFLANNNLDGQLYLRIYSSIPNGSGGYSPVDRVSFIAP